MSNYTIESYKGDSIISIMSKSNFWLYTISYILTMVFWPLVTLEFYFIYVAGIWTAMTLVIVLGLVLGDFKNNKHIALRIYYVLFLGTGLWIEIFVDYLKRNKYNKIAPKILAELNELKVPFHLVCGTLLFYFRDENFRDNDLDLGIKEDDFEKINFKLLRKKGYIPREAWVLEGVLKEISFYSTKYKAQIDFFFLLNKNMEVHGFDFKKGLYNSMNGEIRYNTHTVVYNGVSFDIPEDPDKYLTWLYGDYKKPDHAFHWLYGSKEAIRIVKHTNEMKYYSGKELEDVNKLFGNSIYQGENS